MFGKINIVPRWVIFILDLSICMFSLGIAYYLTYGINFIEFFYVSFSRNLLIITIINCFVFFRLKTYAGIVRYTSAQDAFRILFALVISNVTFLFVNLLIISFYNQPLISNRALIINGLASFLMLILYRILIKYFFIRIKNMHLDPVCS